MASANYTAISVSNETNGHVGREETEADAGAAFVLESKGSWIHAGYHLSTSIVAPALLSLPWAFASLGWVAGLMCLAVAAAVTFYSYNLLSRVLEHLASKGTRHLRFRDLASDVFGPRLARVTVIPTQFAGCFGAVVGSTLLAGQSLKYIYTFYDPDGGMKLYHFTIIFGAVMMVLAQMPSFHSLRYINLISLILSLSYSALVVAGSIYAGKSETGYSIKGSTASKTFGVLNAVAVIATTYGNGIIPEIQATLAPPVSGKMFKGLCICYTVVIVTFFSVSVSGYWAFGNEAEGNVLSNMKSPRWLVLAANVCVLLQLLAVALVYSQPTFEVLEGKSADVKKGKLSVRNVLPRLVLRSVFVAVATVIAAMLPFFGDINALIGAFGFMPLDFVFPMLFYNITMRPSKRSLVFWVNSVIVGVFSVLASLACVAAIRQIILDAHSYKLFADV